MWSLPVFYEKADKPTSSHIIFRHFFRVLDYITVFTSWAKYFAIFPVARILIYFQFVLSAYTIYIYLYVDKRKKKTGEKIKFKSCCSNKNNKNKIRNNEDGRHCAQLTINQNHRGRDDGRTNQKWKSVLHFSKHFRFHISFSFISRCSLLLF